MADVRHSISAPAEDLLTPYPLRRRPQPEPPAERAATIIRMATCIDRQALSLEIQQVCGTVPLHDQGLTTLSELRQMRHKHLTEPPAALRNYLVGEAERAAAYQRLLDRLPCSHCAARDVCPAARMRRVN
jgi:hypothetical protein